MLPEENKNQENAPGPDMHPPGAIISPGGEVEHPAPPAPTALAPVPGPPPTITPVAEPPAQQQPAPAQPGAVPPSPAPVTQADFMALAKKERKWSWKPFIKAGALLSVVAVLAALYFAGLLPFSQFKTVTYDNGVGSTYKLKFYARHTTEPSGQGLPGGDALGSNGKFPKYALVSKVTKDKRAPLKVIIQDKDIVGAEGAYDNNANCGGKEPITTSYNKFAGTDVKVCDFFSGTDSENIMYLATFKKDSRLFIVMFMQSFDANFSNREEAAELLKKVNLTAYKDDIKKIAGSISLDQ